jgi:hypothetical protein
LAKQKVRSIPLQGQGITRGSTIDIPTGGGKPRKGPYRPPKIAESGPREVREGMSRKTEERIIARRAEETARRRTIRTRNVQQRETFQMREEQIRQSASFRHSLRPRKGVEVPTEASSIIAGIIRVLIVIVILSLLLLVLKNPKAGVASAGVTGGFLNNFLTATPQPLFKSK